MKIIRIDSRPGVWYRQDLANALQSVCDAAFNVLAHVPNTLEARSYQAGFTNAMTATAAAFGLAVRLTSLPPDRQSIAGQSVTPTINRLSERPPAGEDSRWAALS